jgi:flagellar hook-associated protein 3 FlgL
MRVSTSQIYDQGTFGIQNNQSMLLKLQNQLSTGRRVVTPEDDPVAASQALVVLQSKELNAQYLRNQDTARSRLNTVESTLGGVTEELQSILERTVQAGNGSYGQGEREMIATELEGRMKTLMGLANTQDGEGLYVFAGFQTQSQPFQLSGNAGPYDLNNTYISYLGDEGQRKLQVDASQEMPIAETGSEIFMRVRDQNGALTGRSIFDSLQNLIDNLNTPVGPSSQADYEQSFNDLKGALDNVSRVRATVGTRLQALDGLSNSAQDLKLQYDTTLSNLQDVDYAEAISSLTRRQMQLEAAQASFAQISRLSLFNVI